MCAIAIIAPESGVIMDITRIRGDSPNQRQMVLDYLRQHGSITQLEALKHLGVMRLGARIFDLRELGHRIDGEMVDVRNRNGDKCRVKRYYLRRAG